MNKNTSEAKEQKKQEEKREDRVSIIFHTKKDSKEEGEAVLWMNYVHDMCRRN